MTTRPDPEVMPRDEPEAKVDIGTMLQISRAEIDGQIATAKAYPRSVARFAQDAKVLVTLDDETAEACIYSLPRGKNSDGSKKFITGASARFAEIIAHSWGNNRAGGRVTEIGKDTITAQGVFHDLEKNTQVTKEVSRSILDSYGKRFKADMVNVTGNAAISIALRNAILAGVPQAFWLPIYEAARAAAVGDISTLVERRANALAWFAKVGVSPESIFSKLGVGGVEDIGIEELETLVGIKTALRRGDYTPEKAFAPEQPEAAAKAAAFGDRMAGRATASGKPDEQVDTTTGEGTSAIVDAQLGEVKPDPVAIRKRVLTAGDVDAIDAAAADISLLPSGKVRDEIRALYDKRRVELEGAQLP